MILEMVVTILQTFYLIHNEYLFFLTLVYLALFAIHFRVFKKQFNSYKNKIFL